MGHQQEKIEISDITREFIIDKLVEPYYRDMVKTTINGKKWWRTIGITLETCSKIMVALGSIFSFSAGFYQDDSLSFVSGSISCMSLALLQIASFSYKENKKQGDELNILLKKLKLDTVPLMPRSEDQMMSQQRQTYARRYSYLDGPNNMGANMGPNNMGPNNMGPNNPSRMSNGGKFDPVYFDTEENRLYEEELLRYKEAMHKEAMIKEEMQRLGEEARQEYIKNQKKYEEHVTVPTPDSISLNNNIDFVVEFRV